MQLCVISHLPLDSLRETLLHPQIVTAVSRTNAVSGGPPQQLLRCKCVGHWRQIDNNICGAYCGVEVSVSPIFNLNCCRLSPVAADGPLKVDTSSLRDRVTSQHPFSAFCGVISSVRSALQPGDCRAA